MAELSGVAGAARYGGGSGNSSSGVVPNNKTAASPMLCYALRLRPGEELKSALAEFVSDRGIRAGFIVSCVGSVRDVVLRLAGAERPSSACRPTATAHPGDPCADTKTPQGQEPQQREEEQQQQPMLSTGADARFEVLSLVGTLSPDGLHVHASLGDEEGAVCGGHLVRAIVHTTAELVIGEAPALVFGREMDPGTGFKELVVSERSAGDREGCDGGADRR